MNLIPLGDKIVVLPNEEPDLTTTPSGIMLPPSAQRGTPTLEGTVVAVGTGTTNALGLIPLTLTCGDKVLFYRNAGTSVKDDDEVEYLVMRESDVIVKRRS